jgi:ClpP class serine protease
MTKATTIAALLGGSATALCDASAAPLLQAQLPAEMARGEAAASLEPGERYALQRGVAIVPVRGLLTANMFAFERYMGWSTYHGIADTLANLMASDDCAAAVIEIDSPGGMVVGIQAAAEAIAAFRAVKPIHALVNPLATSAAYWLASQASDITMTPGAIVGSIGTQVQASSPVQPGSYGDQNFVFRSSFARGKNADASTEKGASLIQGQIDAMEADFHAAIAAGRGIAAADLAAMISATDDPADGGGLFAFADAQRRRLADALLTRAAFYEQTLSRYAPAARPAGTRAFGARAAAAAAIAAS